MTLFSSYKSSHWFLNPNVEKGMVLIDQALKMEPDNHTFLYAQGMGLYMQSKLKEAREVLNRSWELRSIYHHEHYLLIREVEQALASQNQ